MTFSTVVSIGNFLYPDTYNCCVEVLFEDYSSIACSSATTVITITDGVSLNKSTSSTESYMTSESCTVTDCQLSDDHLLPLEYVIAGALGLIILVLLLLQIIVGICLVYVYIYKVSPAKRRLRYYKNSFKLQHIDFVVYMNSL